MKKILLIIIPTVLLSCLSLAVLASFSENKLLPQITFLILALGAGWFARAVGVKNWLIFAKPLYFAVLGLLILTFLFGSVTRGSTRWLTISVFRLQASELAKPVVLLMAVKLFSKPWPDKYFSQWKYLIKRLLVLLPAGGIILLQPDLGTTLVLAVIVSAVIFFSGVPRKLLFSLMMLFLLLIPVGRLALKGYQLQRLESFVDPYKDPKGQGYQVIQSTIAVGSGSFWGRGLGRGTQSQLKFLPERQTDFIFAGLVEELGLVGGLLVIGFYTVMLSGIIAGAFEARKQENWLVIAAAASWLFFQAGINIAMNLGLAPVTGIPLPFLSAGGSSLLASAGVLGITISAILD